MIWLARLRIQVIRRRGIRSKKRRNKSRKRNKSKVNLWLRNLSLMWKKSQSWKEKTLNLSHPPIVLCPSSQWMTLRSSSNRTWTYQRQRPLFRQSNRKQRRRSHRRRNKLLLQRAGEKRKRCQWKHLRILLLRGLMKESLWRAFFLKLRNLARRNNKQSQFMPSRIIQIESNLLLNLLWAMRFQC